jgi:hypothetical protein
MTEQERKERLEFLRQFIDFDNPLLDLKEQFGVDELEKLTDAALKHLTDNYDYQKS